MKSEDLGQNKAKWTNEWTSLSVESEIQMWDFFGLRPWIMKYTPRYGKVIEAGCGLGRYVFLLNRFGVDIEGLDFSKETIDHLNIWKNEHGFDVNFIEGDIIQLPYKNNSLSGYLSFGVIEHFIDGPKKALMEAFRVLQPGGIAIITTPSFSLAQFILCARKVFRNIVKRLIGKPIKPSPFFQYWYTPNQLRKFVEEVGFTVTRYSGSDFLYAFFEICQTFKVNLEKKSFLFNLALKLDSSIFRNWGAQSIVIAVKPSETMHCFLCGEKTASIQSLKKFDTPICNNHLDSEIASYYKNSNPHPKFNGYYLVNPKIEQSEKTCVFSNETYSTDRIFENYGLIQGVHPSLISDKEKSIIVANTQIQPIWRRRGKTL